MSNDWPSHNLEFLGGGLTEEEESAIRNLIQPAMLVGISVVSAANVFLESIGEMLKARSNFMSALEVAP